MNETVMQQPAIIEQKPKKQPARCKIFKIASRVTWLVAQGFLLLAFLLGICTVNGTNMSIVGGIMSVIEIFSIKWKLWYYYLSMLAQGALYITICVLMIKGFVQGLLGLKKKEMTSVYIEDSFAGALKHILVYAFVSGLFSPLQLTGLGVAAIVIGAIVFVVGRLLYELSLPAKSSWLYLLASTGKRIFVVLLLALIGPKVTFVCVEGIIDGLITFGYINFSASGLYVLYRKLAVSVFYAVLIGMYLRVVDAELYDLEVDRRAGWHSFMIASAVFAGVDFTLYMTLGVGSSNQDFLTKIGDYFVVTTTAFPVLLLAIAGKLTEYFPVLNRKGKMVERAETEDSAQGSKLLSVAQQENQARANAQQAVAQRQQQVRRQPTYPQNGYGYGYQQPPVQQQGYGYQHQPVQQQSYGYQQPPVQQQGYGYQQPPVQQQGYGYQQQSAQRPVPPQANYGYTQPQNGYANNGYAQRPAQGQNPVQPVQPVQQRPVQPQPQWYGYG